MILVTGSKGQLGSELVKQLNNSHYEYKGADINDFDITKREETISFITRVKPTLVIHCAGYTLVDKSEDNKDICMAVNYEGTRNIVQACKETNAKLIFITTDYIFDGKKLTPYEIDDTPNPLNFYGMAKMLGENYVKGAMENYFIVRISWLFGHAHNNFVETMIKLGNQNSVINVVDDQIGSPTYTYDVAKLIISLGLTQKYGVYHATNEGFCSWADFAGEIMYQMNIPCRINPIKTDEYGSKAVRPKNSRLSKKSLVEKGFSLLPPWQDALSRYIRSREC